MIDDHERESRPTSWPAPDRLTGEPRPQRAPTIGEVKGHRRSAEAVMVRVPESFGPALEDIRVARSSSVLRNTTAVLVTGLFVYAFAGHLVFQPPTLSAEYLIGGLVAAASPAILFVELRAPVSCAAGSQWLQVGSRWVETYDLVAVTMTEDDEEHTFRLTLTDRNDRTVRAESRLLQQNEHLWSLAHQGIRHSIEAGARTDRTTRRQLLGE